MPEEPVVAGGIAVSVDFAEPGTNDANSNFKCAAQCILGTKAFSLYNRCSFVQQKKYYSARDNQSQQTVGVKLRRGRRQPGTHSGGAFLPGRIQITHTGEGVLTPRTRGASIRGVCSVVRWAWWHRCAPEKTGFSPMNSLTQVSLARQRCSDDRGKILLLMSVQKNQQTQSRHM